jgi:hypothetical protein
MHYGLEKLGTGAEVRLNPKIVHAPLICFNGFLIRLDNSVNQKTITFSMRLQFLVPVLIFCMFLTSFNVRHC